ncbi:MAG: hypothetical protein IJC48_05875 [Clostridia bacterium]|nr:hypothetical protein [Clostridia bacterium]MBQ4158620.1 hypothetical protein [Clostridia bacterium]
MEKRILERFPIGNPRRVWRQKDFTLSTFSPGDVFFNFDDGNAAEKMKKAVKTCYDAGFTMIELGWATPVQSEAALEAAEELGFDVIYQNLKRYGGMSTRIFCEQSDLEGVMEETKKYRCIKGYYIWDEPMHKEQMLETRRLYDIMERKRPELLPFTVANPSYNNQYTWENGLYKKHITDFAEIIDPVVMSFDYYPIGMKEHNASVQLDESRLWLDLALSKRTADRHAMPFWYYYQGQDLHKTNSLTFPMVRLFMNAGVLYGVKGLSHYTAWEAVVDTDGGRGDFFEEQRRIHEEFKRLGNTLMALTLKRVIHDETLLKNCPYMDEFRVSIDESEHISGALPARISESEHIDDYGNEYIMILNRDYAEDQEIALVLKNEKRVYEVSKEDGRQRVIYERTGELRFTLRPGELKILRLQHPDDSPFEIEYRLKEI